MVHQVLIALLKLAVCMPKYQVLWPIFSKTNLHPCWELNIRPLACQGSMPPRHQLVLCESKSVLKFELQQSIPIICQLTVGIEFFQFGKKSNGKI